MRFLCTTCFFLLIIFRCNAAEVKLVADNEVAPNVRAITLSLDVPAMQDLPDEMIIRGGRQPAIIYKISDHLKTVKGVKEYSYDRATARFTLIATNDLDLPALLKTLNELEPKGGSK